MSENPTITRELTDDQSLVRYIEREREKDPDFKKLLLPTDGTSNIISYEQMLKIVQNDMKYLEKIGIRVKQWWGYNDKTGKTFHVQPDIEQ